MTTKRTKMFGLALCFAALLPAWVCAEGKLGFREIWAYLMAGEERFLGPQLPVTDIGYFGAGLNSYGKLIGVPKRAGLGNFSGRAHLVIAEVGNYALTHFVLDPAYPLRNALIDDIVRAAAPFDGVQIDFETVPADDYEHFFTFLQLLRARLPDKLLSVALPARIDAKTDRFGYARIAALVDRVIVMAYDEHWSTSAPGPVASIEWCRNVAAYASSQIPERKLVMGAPFYGRAWADKSLSRAYKFSSLAELIAEKCIAEIQRLDEVPFFEYAEQVTVRLFFDDARSTLRRLSLYRALPLRNIAFWRLGQEDPAIWEGLALEGDSTPEALESRGEPFRG